MHPGWRWSAGGAGCRGSSAGGGYLHRDEVAPRCQLAHQRRQRRDGDRILGPDRTRPDEARVLLVAVEGREQEVVVGGERATLGADARERGGQALAGPD